MDLITQGILGAAVAEAGWRGRLGSKAIYAGIVFGLLPDADVIAGAIGGPWTGMVHHRGFTHSIFFAPLMAPVFGWLLWKLSKQDVDHLKHWIFLVFFALITHPLLDVFTSYGTQLLTPVSDRRFALDGISIIDPLYTLPLLIGLILAFIWRKKPTRGKVLMRVLLVLTTAYLGFGTYTSTRVKEEMKAQLEVADLGPPVQRVRAMPTLGNLALWRVVAQDLSGNILVGMYSTMAPPQKVHFDVLKKPDSPLIARAHLDERVNTYDWFTDGWTGYVIDETKDNQLVLHMPDMRYGGISRPMTSMWGVDVTFEPGTQRIVSVERVQDRDASTGGDVGKELKLLWRYMWEGPDKNSPR